MIMKRKEYWKDTQETLMFIIRLLSSSCAELQHLLECAEKLCARERSSIIVRVGTFSKIPMKYFVL